MTRFPSLKGFRVLATTIPALALLAVSLSPAGASSGREIRGTGSTPTVLTTFRLHVSTPAPAGTTFWVAYGPLGGQWGLLRLTPSGHRLYSASRRLPTAGSTVFAYLSGHGVVHTRAGIAPSNPVVVIRRVGPITAAGVSQLTVQYVPPAG